MNYKIIIIAFVALFGIAAGVTSFVTRQKEYKVEHRLEVPQTVSEDGFRYQAGSPEEYWVDPAPALIWKLTKSKGFRLVAIIVLCLVVLYIGICYSGAITYNGKYFFAGLVISAGCWFGAYTSAFENNTRKLSPEQYEIIKDSVNLLWTKENYTR